MTGPLWINKLDDNPLVPAQPCRQAGMACEEGQSAYTLKDIDLYLKLYNPPPAAQVEYRALLARELPGIGDDPALPIIRNWCRVMNSSLQGLKDYLVAEKGVPPEEIEDLAIGKAAELLKQAVRTAQPRRFRNQRRA